MRDVQLKKLLASSFAFKANNKARRELNRVGNDISDFNDVVVKPGSDFDKYLNTYLALIDYVLNHENRSSKLDGMNVDPTDYQIKPILTELINCSKIMLNSASTVLQTPVFQLEVPNFDADFMLPSYFNAYQLQFTNVGDADLFGGVEAFQPKVVTLDALKSVSDGNGSLYMMNSNGSVPSEIVYALEIHLPIDDISKYAATDISMTWEGLVVWLSQQM